MSEADIPEWGDWVENVDDFELQEQATYGIIVDPDVDENGKIEVLWDDGVVRRWNPNHGAKLSPAIVQADNPEAYTDLQTAIQDHYA